VEAAEDDGLAVVDAPTALRGFLLALRLPRYRLPKQVKRGRRLAGCPSSSSIPSCFPPS
jgi:hypothetical protein